MIKWAVNLILRIFGYHIAHYPKKYKNKRRQPGLPFPEGEKNEKME